MKFSIITPSYNMLSFLELCCLSVKDQKNVSLEHLIVDGKSSDGTQSWLAKQNGIKWVSENDKGMYDALNKGIKIAKGDIIGFLNCDEQYLLGTLDLVHKLFYEDKNIDVVYGHTLIIDKMGKLIALKKASQLIPLFILAKNIYTASIFYRRHIFDNLKFDAKLMSNADQDFILNAIKYGYNFKKANSYFSAFILHESNLSSGVNAKKETIDMISKHCKALENKYFLNAIQFIYYFHRISSGCYHEENFKEYSIYLGSTNRTNFVIDKPKYTIKHSY